LPEKNEIDLFARQPTEEVNKATDKLTTISHRYPRAWGMVEQFLADRGRDVPSWPRWCFLPLAGWYAIISAHIGRNRIGPDRAGDIARLAALGTWRYSLGVYRFDQAVYDALINTGLSDAPMPADVLLRLPEWCVYIETPGLVGLDG
jgi:hypothetical protein